MSSIDARVESLSKFTQNSITHNIHIPSELDLLQTHFSQYFDKSGQFLLDKFTQALGRQEIDISEESYSMGWLGKNYARLLATDPATTLLKEDTLHNNQLEHTQSQNLLIKGDNLEVLKHLVGAYHEQVKMIYIDPPYNTGNDGFVYQDNRKYRAEELQKILDIDEEQAKRILNFTQSKSNSHSAWLTFMYPRLYIAKQLLREDGVIFISIDDNEVAQLKMLMDDVFGEENSIAQIPWKGKGGGADNKFLIVAHEYICMYSKSRFTIGEQIKKDEKFPKYDGGKKRFYKTQLARKWGANSRRLDRPNLFYSISAPDGATVYPMLPQGEDGRWRWKKQKMLDEIQQGNIEFLKDEESGTYIVYEKIYQPLEGEYNTKKFSTWIDYAKNTARGSEEVGTLFDTLIKVFNFPKPTVLIKCLLQIGNTQEDDIILDFFAGSGTTGDAVMQLNAEDGGNRKYILVQLNEAIDPKKNKTAYDFVKDELGVKNPTIFEITKERLIRAGNKIKKEKPEYTGDLGFKVFETTPIWENYHQEAEEQEQYQLFNHSTLTPEDMQTLLTTWKTYDGFLLTQALIAKDLAGYDAYYGSHTGGNYLYLMNQGFTTYHLISLLQTMDGDREFSPTVVVCFGYYFDSKSLRELAESLKPENNKKLSQIKLEIRY
ncbi:site-specific DNA-methyltransferase [Candidatus Nitrosacidococcus sp. I8]|uniref:site-specific DNA-methyltransferase n=1 Tax=Candidatus Nitrosacidococcus sp. I8 TaxID=2942908 RepID=UPI002227FBC9|nr:site-specific DNA-methyltransferase [Candidatus Nitrosacidococcus sp. I8]CAH9018723.1 hypothetical protein NURINAE_01096 [Candidatus Nitrosacidococcus sp. I8]